ncbi:MAG: hypothetical protein J6D34_03765 [Atopobiaceae bacterium]|nr:hypothetical protein [Atopobiaceae bacterium]
MTDHARAGKSLGLVLASASLCSMLVMPATQAVATEAGQGGLLQNLFSSNRSNAPVPEAKHEVVRARTDATGAIRNVEVTTTLKTNGKANVADVSSLNKITPVDQDVYITNEGDIVWHSNDGRDITYTGTTNATLPIKVKVTYTLDGEELTPRELLGKSGHLSIRYDYIDTEQESSSKMSHEPFTAVTSIALDPAVFSNIEVTNGKTITESGLNMAFGCGIAKKSTKKTEIPNFFQVDADVTNFKLGQTVTIAASNASAALHGDVKVARDLSSQLNKELENYLTDMEQFRAHLSDVNDDAFSVAGDLDIVRSVADQLEGAFNEIEGVNSHITDISNQTYVVADAAETVSVNAQAFISSISSMDGLSEEQKSAIIAEWDATGMDSMIGDLSAQAQALRDTASTVSVNASEQALADMRGIDFAGIDDRARSVSDRLTELLGTWLGEMDASDDDTMMASANRLKADLAKFDRGLAVAETSSGGMATGVLEFASQENASGNTANQTSSNTGFGKLVKEVNDALTALGKNISSSAEDKDAYSNFAGILEGTEGSTEFVFETQGIM